MFGEIWYRLWMSFFKCIEHLENIFILCSWELTLRCWGYISGQLGTGRICCTQGWQDLLCRDSSESHAGQGRVFTSCSVYSGFSVKLVSFWPSAIHSTLKTVQWSNLLDLCALSVRLLLIIHCVYSLHIVLYCIGYFHIRIWFKLNMLPFICLFPLFPSSPLPLIPLFPGESCLPFHIYITLFTYLKYRNYSWEETYLSFWD